MKVCTGCGQEKAVDQFYRRSTASGATAYASRCKACAYDALREWRAANPDKHRAQARRRYNRDPERAKAYERERYQRDPERVRATVRAYRATHAQEHNASNQRRRAVQMAATIGNVSAERIAQKVAYWGNRCWMCGSAEAEHLDHVKPLSKGGAHMLANLRPACGSCNCQKNARWPYPTRRGWALRAS